MSETPIEANIAKVLEQVSIAADRCQRPREEIRVLAVSKTQSAEAVRRAAACGLSEFGENYLQEAESKIPACADLKLCWHFIGPLQSNKTRAVAAHFSWVHSVDRGKLLRRLNDQRPDELDALNICVQVNISREASKAGVAPGELEELLALTDELPRLRLRGLMAIPAPAADFYAQREPLDALARLFREARARYPSMDTLSMGMSSDLEAAVASGSTLLRIGTAIFGPRSRAP
ncbi:MAG: YggS family pyridoxal phosphate-dependent enzyme [Halieaceae bacterium]|jgi:pyridoxal phosphate enzyme (YggS family)|nr:YggS family pyridoxal phosphate-dependent enzyme [Halieaceae bacterium]